jgi:membrane-associated phospholipid phosphatase
MKAKSMMWSQGKAKVFLVSLTVFGASRMAAKPPHQTPPSTAPSTAPGSPSGQFDRPISWKLLIPNFFSDQQRIWTFPAQVAQDRDVMPTAAVLGATAGLVLFDPIEAPYFRRSTTFNGFNNILSGNATVIGTILAPASLYGIGLLRKDSRMQRTALLAGEAVADAELVTTVVKDATKRVRPQGISNNFYDSWFESGGSVLRGNGSFPSGHTIAAFSIATVVARRYNNHRWVPYICYGAAALVGFSRLTLSAHFVSDVFMGGALGYSISRFAVLRQ